MRIVQVLRNRLICGPGAALTWRSSSGFSPDRPDSRQLEPNGCQKSAKQTQFRVVGNGTSKGWPCRKLSQSQAWPTEDRAAQNAEQRDETTRKLGADEPKMRLQLVNCNSLTSNGFVRPPSIEPIPGTAPSFRRLEERPAAFWKNHKESRKRKLSRKETVLELDRLIVPRLFTMKGSHIPRSSHKQGGYA